MVLLVGILSNLQNKKTILDALKRDTIQALEGNTITDAILDQIAVINSKIGSMDINGIGDGTVTGAIDYLNHNLFPVNNPQNYDNFDTVVGVGTKEYSSLRATQIVSSENTDIYYVWGHIRTVGEGEFKFTKNNIEFLKTEVPVYFSITPSFTLNHSSSTWLDANIHFRFSSDNGSLTIGGISGIDTTLMTGYTGFIIVKKK